MAIIGSVNNYGSLQGEVNGFGNSLTGVISSAGYLGGTVIAERGLKGEKGDTGDTGATGVGIASIAKTSSVGLVDTYTITYTDGNSVTFTVTNGADGQASVVTATKVGDTTTIYIDGVASAIIVDGQDGQNGQDGADGADGFSPIANVSKVGHTATITITDENGTTTAQIIDGGVVNDLGNIDPSDYEDDRDVFLNTLLDDGIYRFVWEDGDDYELYVVVESMIDNGYVYQKYWSTEEGAKYQYHCTLIVEDGEVTERYEDTYLTLSDASGMFSAKTHAHYDSIDDAMSVFDWCDTNDLTFDNAKPFILYTDTLNDKNWVIERYASVRLPKYRFIKVYDMSDASHFYIRSGSVIGDTTTWGSWKEYTVGGGGGSVNDVEVNGTSVVSGGVAEVTVPTNTSDLNNDSLYARGHIATFHGTCSTAAGTGEKAVTCADFKASDLVAGAMILVTFSNANSAAVADLALNVNSTGAYPIKQNKAGTVGNFDDKSYLKASTYPFIFDGTNWVAWYNTDTNTIGYNIRTNAGSLPVSGQTGRYRLLFTSADGTKFVPPNTSNSTSATASKTVNQEKIDPFGAIKYYATTTVLSSGTRPSVSYQYQQYYTVSLGYSFNRTGSALTLTAWKPVYVKCAPQTDGSAIIDADNPFVQDLPTTADGKIYIFLGIAINETNIDFMLSHPVYCYKNGHIQQYTNADTAINVFIATYNVTSYADILSAIASGKDVVCVYSETSGAVTDTYYVPLAYYTNGESTEYIQFSTVYDSTKRITISVDDDDAWSVNTTSVGDRQYRTTDTTKANGTTWTTVSSSSVYVTLDAGTWLIIGYAKYASNATGVRALRLYNDTDSLSLAGTEDVRPAVSGSATRIQSVKTLVTSAKKTIVLQVYQNSGSTLNVTYGIEAVRIA